MADAARQALRRQGGADHRAAVVVDLNEVVLFDAELLGVLRVEAQHEIVPAADIDAVVLDIEEEAVLAVALGMIAEPRMRRQELERIFAEERARMRPLPRRLVF